MTKLYFKCEKCDKEFDFNVGKVSNFINGKFTMENEPTCSICGNNEESNILLSDKNDSKLQKILNKEARKKAIKSYKPGELMCYEAIFGGGEIFKIKFNDSDYKIADYYCVAPNCECNEVILHAFHTNSNLDEPLWSIAYDYILNRLGECENIQENDTHKILNIIKEYDKEVFSKRHKSLKSELRTPLHNKFFKNKKSVIKTGRNDPCPCRSGKKYKKCCLDKEKK